MTDYADIKRRLRELDTCDERGSFMPCPVGQAAADAIEALEKERDAYKAHAKPWGDEIRTLRARVAELEGLIRSLREDPEGL